MIEFLTMLIPMFRSYKVMANEQAVKQEGNHVQFSTWVCPVNLGFVDKYDKEIGRFTCFEWLGFAPRFEAKLQDIVVAYSLERLA